MSLKAGIVGLPNVGKSTLFNAITKKNILAANYPFATIEPNVGVVLVPDRRLEVLRDLYKPNSFVPTSFEFIDIAGLVEGAASGEGLGNKFLSHIRSVDAIVHVVRCFDDKNITHVSGDTNPIRDIEIINCELVLSDLEIVEARLSRIEKKAVATKDKELLEEVRVLTIIKEALVKNELIRNMELSEDDLAIIKNFNFITLKKVIYAANVSEDDIVLGDNEYTNAVKEYAEKEGASALVMSAKLEEDLASLEEDEKKAFLESLGVPESGLDKLIFESYDLLGLATYFTSGVQEVRAWTFKKGMKAPACAGIIHSDIERGFIRAEVTSFTDIEELGSEKKVQEAGKLRVEGKEYEMCDGDVCYFRFNV